MKPFTVRLRFYGDLVFFLRSGDLIERQLGDRTSTKDLIEACGVPHPEVDLIVLNGRPADFAEVIGTETDLDVYPTTWKRFTLFPENRMQSTRIQQFVADGHLGKLVRDLRLLGIDVLYERDAQDRQLLDLASIDNRALLTRDRRLLMHAVLRHGYYLRSQNPFEQTVEVLRRFELASALYPFTRCLGCNAPLEHVDKAEVFDRLEPLTKIHYERFRRCAGCGQIYWQGSHFDKLRGRVEDVRTAMANAKEK